MTEVVKYAGVDLRSFGLFMNVADGVDSPPPVRGKNLLIPYQHGQRPTTKYYDERIILLVGEMHSLVSRADLQAKLDTLKALFPIGSGEQKLEIQRADGSYRYAMAEIRNTMGLQRLIWPIRSVPYSIELVASDPLWYNDVLQAPDNFGAGAWTLDSGVLLDDGAHWLGPALGALFAISLAQQATVIAHRNSGTAPNRQPVFTLTGQMGAPKITNATNGLSIQVLHFYGPTDRQVLVIDCGKRVVTLNGIVIPSNEIVLGTGQTDWMRLDPGDNNLNVDLGVATPTVAYQASFAPAYL
jgi:Phage tail protein